MWIRLFLVTCVLALNSTGPVYALDSSRLKLKILPLECLTDVVDDGLNVYQFEEHPNCGNPPENTHTPNSKEDSSETVPGITYLNNSGVTTSQLRKAEPTNKLSVAYNVVFNGLHQRQSLLHTIIITLSTVSTVSLIAFILRFL